MANTDGLGPYTGSTGTEILFSCYGNDIVNLSSGAGYNQNLTSGSKAEFAPFLDALFMVNGVNNNRRFNGTLWLDETARRHAPIAKYILSARTRIFLGNISYLGTTYASRVWFSDLPKNNDIQYGIEYGTDLNQLAGNPHVFSTLANFKTRGVKVGDPFTITTGANAGEYIVQSIDTEQQVTLTTPMVSTVTGSSFWVGRNWFDVNTNDGDVITGLGENNDRVLVFKRLSLFRYDGSTLRKVKGVPGTTSQRSVVNIKNWTFYANDQGLWRYDGVTSELISRGVQDIIDGIPSANLSSLVGWVRDGEVYRIFLGNISNSETGLTMTNAVLDFDTATNTLSPGTLADSITCSASWINSSSQDTYLGTTTSQVMKDNTGYSHNGTPISWKVEDGFNFPVDPSTDTEMKSIQIHTQRGRNVAVKYKLYGTPDKIDKDWRSLGDLHERVTTIEFDRKEDRFARGINIMFTESGAVAGPIIERFDVFHLPHTRKELKESGY